MPSSVWELLGVLFQWRDRSTDREHRFCPSPVDLSVRTGHGGDDGAIADELASVADRARDVEAIDRRK